MSEVKEHWICEKCGASSSGKFCSKCGAACPKSEEWDCSCGKTGNTGKFCPKCGKTRDNKSVVDDGNGVTGGNSIQVTHDTVNQTVVHTATEGNKRSVNPQQKKIMAIIAALVIVYFAFGMITEKLYESQCEKYTALSMEIQDTYKKIGELNGDVAAEETKFAVKKLKDEADRLDSIHSFLDKIPTPEKAKLVHRNTLAVMSAQKEYLLKTSDLLLANDRCVRSFFSYRSLPGTGDSEKTFEEFNEAYDESLKLFTEAIEDNKDLRINNQSIGKLIHIEKMNTAIYTYISKKVDFDTAWYREKKKGYYEKLTASNEALKQKKEVVFLVRSVETASNSADGKKYITVTGFFYNGTDDYVTGIGDMLVDVKLNSLDKEISSLSDVAYHDKILEKLSLPSKGTSSLIFIQLKELAPEETFDNFEVNVHKIHWNARKLVRR